MTQYSTESLPPPLVGQVLALSALATKRVTALDPTGPVAQVTTVTIGASPDNDATYSYSVNVPGYGLRTVSYLTDSSTSQSELAAGLLAAAKADPILAGAFALTGTTSTVAHTARQGNLAYAFAEVADPDASLSISTGTAASAGREWKFGRYAPLGGFLSSPLNRKLVAPASLAGPVLTLTITHGAGASYSVPLAVSGPDGVTRVLIASWSAGGSAAATDDAAEAALLALFPVAQGYVITNPSTGSVLLAAPNGFTVTVAGEPTGAGGGGAPDLAASVADGSTVPPFALVIDPDIYAPSTVGTRVTAAPAGQGVSCLVKDGGIAIVCVEDPGASVTSGGAVYIETTTGDNYGRPYTLPSPSRVLRESALWVVGGLGGIDGTTVAYIQEA